MTDDTPKPSDRTISVSFDTASFDRAIRDQFIPAVAKALEVTVAEFMEGLDPSAFVFETLPVAPVQKRIDRLARKLDRFSAGIVHPGEYVMRQK